MRKNEARVCLPAHQNCGYIIFHWEEQGGNCGYIIVHAEEQGGNPAPCPIVGVFFSI